MKEAAHDTQKQPDVLFLLRSDEISSNEVEPFACPWCGLPTWQGEQCNGSNGYTALMAHCKDVACINYGKTYTFALRYDGHPARRIPLRYRPDGFVDYLPRRTEHRVQLEKAA